MKHLDIKITDHVVFYHVSGSMWSSRAYWMMKAYGHNNVQVLNGGLKKWIAEGKKVESRTEGIKEEEFAYHLNTEIALNFERITAKVEEKESSNKDI